LSIAQAARSRLAAPGARLRGAAALAVGAALTLAQPPIGFWPALVPGWCAALWLLRMAATARAAARTGFLAGFGFFLTGLHWVGSAFLVEAGNVWWYAPVMPFAVALLAAACALFWAGGFALAHAARARLAAPGWADPLTLAWAMAAAEAARGALLTGFPWALQAYAWTETPVIQAAALGGAPLLSALTVAAAAAPMAATRRAPWPALGAAAALAASWAWGAARLEASVATAPRRPVIRLVQPNVPQGDKWEDGRARRIFDNLVSLTAEPAAAAPALVVWPEVAVTFLFDRSPDALALALAAAPPGASLAVGSVRAEGEHPGWRLFNSLLFHGPDGAALGFYDKRRLTPFGEYVPYAWVLGRLGIGTLGEGLSGFTPGALGGPFALPGLPPFAPLICYEIVFPRDVLRAAEGADWILQVTNDAWFGDSGGPWQHLAQARARAVELGLPVARAANTGISAMIDSHGRIAAQLPLGARGALDAPLPGAAPPTPFRRLGFAPALALFAIVSALMIARAVFSRAARRNIG
jgi:apolipoprotein N-acyltransferase